MANRDKQKRCFRIAIRKKRKSFSAIFIISCSWATAFGGQGMMAICNPGAIREVPRSPSGRTGGARFGGSDRAKPLARTDVTSPSREFPHPLPPPTESRHSPPVGLPPTRDRIIPLHVNRIPLLPPLLVRNGGIRRWLALWVFLARLFDPVLCLYPNVSHIPRLPMRRMALPRDEFARRCPRS